jgi:hypothetical protein
VAKNEVLTNEQFVVIWEKHDNLEAIEREMAAVYKAAGLRPPGRPTIAARAGQLRAKGVQISRKKAGPKAKTDLARLNELAETVRAAVAAGKAPASPVVPPVPRPPEPPDQSDVIRRMLDELHAAG